MEKWELGSKFRTLLAGGIRRDYMNLRCGCNSGYKEIGEVAQDGQQPLS